MHPRSLILFFALIFVLLQGLAHAAGESAAAHGLRISDTGTILKDDKPYYGMGVNYMDAFTRCLKDGKDISYREGFAILAEYDIPFARLNFGGFYPSEWKLYQGDPDAYFALMDGVVRAAEETGVGLVPSLFWWTACIPDLMGESRNQWGNPASETHAFMGRYVTDVVSRYKDSPAIWAWEFGNEYNLAADLPNAKDSRPPNPVHKGCPPERGPGDDLTSEMLRTALMAFGEAVRAIDPYRAITSGNSIPRPSSHHQHTELSWANDNQEEFRGNLQFMTPDPLDLVSIHVYPHAREKRFGEDRVSYGTLFAEATRAAREGKKGLFLGEFGPPPDNKEPWTRESARAEGEQLVAALLDSPVQLAAFWVFDFAWQEKSMSVTTTNHRKGYLNILQEANRQLALR
ncbi:MAG: glycoside hydrolase family 5 protein [Candidatus Hydrogenedentes bacterium]|nr:glycoside hydrolase family 5 protein [Candidatus Hydrogenedentota bacterium]